MAGYDESGIIQANLKKSCPICSGNGYILTDLGRGLWNLYRPMLLKIIKEEIEKSKYL